jgi:hypothetical protein
MNYLIAVPTRGQIHARTAEALQELRDLHGAPPIRFAIDTLSVSSVRNLIVRDFLALQFDVLVMIDADVIPPRSLPSLVERLQPGIVDIAVSPCMIFPDSSPAPHPAVYEEVDGGYVPLGESGDLVECAAGGSGCIAIGRWVLEHPDMRAPFSTPFDKDGVSSSSEDLEFCIRAGECGFRIWADFDRWSDHLPSDVNLRRVGIFADVSSVPLAIR